MKGCTSTTKSNGRNIRRSFAGSLLEAYSSKQQSDIGQTTRDLLISLKNNDMEEFRDNITVLFSSIPHQIFLEKFEAYYHSIIFLTLRLLGRYITVEQSSSRGRSDAVVRTDEIVYVFEFKMPPNTAEDAIKQIKEKGYHTPYLKDKREKFMIGITFDPDKKQIGEMKIEEF